MEDERLREGENRPRKRAIGDHKEHLETEFRV